MQSFQSPRVVLWTLFIAATVGATPYATAGLPVVPPNGPHGCALTDVAGQSAPVLHDSDTSHIGGRSCVYLQVGSDPSLPQGGSYEAAAQSWSVTSQKQTCRPARGRHRKVCTWVLDPAGTFTSAKGSSNVGQYVLPVGDKVTVTVTNGTINTGTPDGAPGA
jgi:hypothetical protein